MPLTPDRAGRREVAAALLLGVLVLLATRGAAFPGLAWNDELVYAAAGRHVADGQGPLSSFYHPDAIRDRGFPLPDVHMPGQAFVLGAVFRLFGPGEAVAVATSRLAFLATAVAIVLGCRRWGRRSALAAAVLFLVFPPHAAFAHTAMSESVLTLLVTAFFAAWLGAPESAGPARAAALALLLGLGATQRETVLLLVPAAAWAIARGPQRGRALLAGAAVLGAYLAFVFVPLYRARAPHPHVLTDVLLLGDTPAALAGTIGRNLLDNVAALPFRPRAAWEWTYALQLAAVAAAAVLGRRAGGERRRAAALAVLGFAGTWAALAPFYPIADWRAVRLFMPSLPPALAVIADALAAARSRAWVPRTLVAAGVLGVSVVALRDIGRDRAQLDAFGRAYAGFIARYAGPAPRLVVATKAYRYGWDAYPVAVVVWEATDLKRVRVVEQLVSVDAIVVRDEEKRRFLHGLQEGAYRRPFRLASVEPFHSRYNVYVADDGAAR